MEAVMDANRFGAWTRRRFGLAEGSVVAAIVALRHNRAWGAPARWGATHQGRPADARDRGAGAYLAADMRPSHRTPWKKPLVSHRFLRAPALALLAVLLVAGPAFSAIRTGTEDSETLIGTKRTDQITGAGGHDRLIGKAGNDTYFFDDNWGQDRLIETRRGGKDTLDFTAVDSGGVLVLIVREFDKFEVSGPGNSLVLPDDDAGIPYIETVIGGQGDGDALVTGGGPQTLNPGRGRTDILQDYGGYDDGASFDPAIPASNDTYVGFNNNTGRDTIRDWGGTDVVDMRPISSTAVIMTRIDDDGPSGTEESLQIAMQNDPDAIVVINGHYGPFDPFSSSSSMDGHIEKLIFADVTYTDKNPPVVESTGAGQATRDKRTEISASETLSAAGENADEAVEAEANVAPDTHKDRADKGKKARKAKHIKGVKRGGAS
jgi:hypothetical protein